MLESSGLAGISDNKSFGARAMRQLSAIAFVGMIVLPIASCGNSGEDINTASLPQEAPAREPFTKPIAPQSPPSAVPSPVLIQPTNANQRAKQVQTGRQDPFAGLFLQTAPRSSQVASQPSSPSNAPAPSPASNGGSAGSEQNAEPNAGSQPGGGANSNGNIGSPPIAQDDSIPFPPPDEGSFPPPLPSIPEPELARKVAVSGVVQIGEQLQAIVQVPNEGTSRYVRVGQRLSNGEILVKRIEMSPGIEPVVILEQYGVEVSKAIGEQTAESDASDTTTPSPTPPPEAEVEVEEPEPVPSPEVTSPAPPIGTPVPVPVPVAPPTVPNGTPNATPIPSPPPFTPGPGEF
ncbi:hypothetical protein [Gloeocapsopsis dulcis]|uniref:Uncharacterized protein n=1 Tax=Gloeocapsopsis dulcis AAB1 = 1H9 TaxID=1433147 RepID=A0A6N8FSF4_9CHRO|nr:hypothetical protein [Gloeocapsopsis dulcis]MUL36023.1 hypothetical protein [Gloeocapsopsis dulcis AAB1 = 1H9]WNN88276.1 hypothetical protein P0S91_18555 [Gloeocapsopsis dulcis]